MNYRWVVWAAEQLASFFSKTTDDGVGKVWVCWKQEGACASASEPFAQYAVPGRNAKRPPWQSFLLAVLSDGKLSVQKPWASRTVWDMLLHARVVAQDSDLSFSMLKVDRPSKHELRPGVVTRQLKLTNVMPMNAYKPCKAVVELIAPDSDDDIIASFNKMPGEPKLDVVGPRRRASHVNIDGGVVPSASSGSSDDDSDSSATNDKGGKPGIGASDDDGVAMLRKYLKTLDAIKKPRKVAGQGLNVPTLKTIRKEMKKNGYDIYFGKTKLGMVTSWGPRLNNTAAGCQKHGSKCRATFSTKSCPTSEALQLWVIDGLSCDMATHMICGKAMGL